MLSIATRIDKEMARRPDESQDHKSKREELSSTMKLRRECARQCGGVEMKDKNGSAFRKRYES